MPSLADLTRYDAGRTIQFGEAGQKQRTLADLGQYAAQGDYGKASAAAFAGGQVDIGAALAKMDQAKQQQIVQDAASYAQAADTPEKWAQAGAEFSKTHPGVEWPQDFRARDVTISRALSAQEQIANRLKERAIAVDEQKAAQGSGQTLSPEATDLVAMQFLSGDRQAIVGYARNPAMKAQLVNRIAEMAGAMGMDGRKIAAELSAYAGNVAGQRSAGTRAAQVGMAASEANQMADIALEASNNVPRSAFVPWNVAMNAVRTGTSSPEMAQFVTATTSLVNAYARAISPLGAPTDAMRQHAEEMLNTAQSPEAYAAVIAQMKKEMEAALNAPAEISTRLKQGVAGDGAASGGGDAAAPSDGGNDPLGIR